MAFININKVTLEDTNDIKVAMSNVMLVFSSIIHDHVDKKEYNDALGQIGMLKQSVWNLEHILKKELNYE